jgi:ATP-dependent exoDNAse (exonuclease V) beta subunit
LHLFGGWKWNKKEQRPDCDKGSFLSLLWPFFETHIAVSQAPEVNVKSNEALPSQLPQLILANEPDLVCEAIVQNPEVELPELRVPDPDNIALGQAFHIWMQLIHDHWEQGWSKDWFEQNRPALKSTLHMAGASEHKLDELVLNLSEMILSALSDPNSREMISPEAKGGSWAELAFVSRDGVRMQRHILDLMYVDDAGDAHIVDYKTGSLSDESISGWEDQLSRYKDIVTRTTGVKVEDAQIYHAQLSSK